MRRLGIKTNKGFTLIETIIYVGLFGIMIVGLFVSLFQIMYNTHDLKNTVSVEEEMNFAIRKINWLLNDMTAISTVSSSGLDFEKGGDAGWEIKLTDTRIEVCEGSDCDFITSEKVSVTDLEFIQIPTTGTITGVEIIITINGRVVGIKKFIRI